MLVSYTLPAQKTTVFTEAHEDFKRGLYFYDQGLYAQSIQEFEKVLTKLKPVNESDADLLKTKAEPARPILSLRNRLWPARMCKNCGTPIH